MKRFLLLLFACFFLSKTALAIEISVEFSGTVTALSNKVDETLPPEIAAIDIGDSFYGTFSYLFSESAVDTYTSSSSVGVYNVGLEYTIHFESVDLFSSRSHGLYVADAQTRPDYLIFDLDESWSLPYAYSDFQVDEGSSVIFRDLDGLSFNSDALTDLSSFVFGVGSLNIAMGDYYPGPGYGWAEQELTGEINYFNATTPIPEPTTFFLFGLGSAVLLGKRKFSKNK